MADEDVIVFIAILAVVALAVAAVFAAHLPLQLAAAALLVIIALALFHPNVLEFKEYERGVLFRLGRFHSVVGPGWVVYFSTIDSVTRVDLRTQVLDIEPQYVITQDNVKVKIDSVVYYRIVDPKKSVVEVRDFSSAVEHLLVAQLRNVTGKLLLEEVLEKTEEINLDLFNVLKDVEDKWGIRTSRVEISSIELPPGLLSAMQRRREADEYKESVETEARAKQATITILDQALRSMSDRSVTYLYLDALKKIGEGKSSKIIFPLELTHLATVISKEAGLSKGGEGSSGMADAAKAFVEACREKGKETPGKSPEQPAA